MKVFAVSLHGEVKKGKKSSANFSLSLQIQTIKTLALSLNIHRLLFVPLIYAFSPTFVLSTICLSVYSQKKIYNVCARKNTNTRDSKQQKRKEIGSEF